MAPGLPDGRPVAVAVTGPAAGPELLRERWSPTDAMLAPDPDAATVGPVKFTAAGVPLVAATGSMASYSAPRASGAR